MVATINTLMEEQGPSVMYDPEFRQVIEDMRTDLIEDEDTQWIDIRPDIANQHDGDFYAVLREYDIPRQMHWIVLRINGYDSPIQFRTENDQILIPSQTKIQSIVRVFRANRRLIKKARNG